MESLTLAKEIAKAFESKLGADILVLMVDGLTTQADYFYGPIPCLRCLTKEEIDDGYEKNTGVLITDYFKDKDHVAMQAALCKNHGPFGWGKDPIDAVHTAVVLEEVAKMAVRTEMIKPDASPCPLEVQDKHYTRKHGPNAYYGQR